MQWGCLDHTYKLLARSCSFCHCLQCDRTIALDALFKQLLSEDNISKLAVVGCGCSVATEPTAEVSHYYNVTHISIIHVLQGK